MLLAEARHRPGVGLRRRAGPGHDEAARRPGQEVGQGEPPGQGVEPSSPSSASATVAVVTSIGER